MKAHYIEFDKNKKIQVNEYGNSENPTIICLGGWTLPIEDGKIFLEKLSKNFHIYTLNYPGYLNSHASIKAQSLNFLSSLIDLVIREMKINNFHLLGVSMGGQTVLRYIKNSKFQNKVILIGSSAYPVKKNASGFAKIIIKANILVSITRSIGPLKYKLVNDAFKTAQLLTKNVREIINFEVNSCSLNGAFDTFIGILKDSELPKSGEKFFYIYGERDDYAREVKENNIQNVNIINDAGHIPYFRSPKEVVAVIKKVIL